MADNKNQKDGQNVNQENQDQQKEGFFKRVGKRIKKEIGYTLIGMGVGAGVTYVVLSAKAKKAEDGDDSDNESEGGETSES